LTPNESAEAPVDAEDSPVQKESEGEGSPEQKTDNPVAPDVFSDINEAEDNEEEFAFSVHENPPDVDGDSAEYEGQDSGEGVDDVMLGAGDDGTLTTVTNSVIDSFSFQDHSISPRSSGRYDALSYAGTATVLGAEPEPHAADRVPFHQDSAGAGDQTTEARAALEDSSVGSYEEDEASPSYDDIVAQGLSSSPSQHSDDESAVSSLAHPPPPSNSHAEYDEHGEYHITPLGDGTASPTMLVNGAGNAEAAASSTPGQDEVPAISAPEEAAEAAPAADVPARSQDGPGAAAPEVNISHFEASLGAAWALPAEEGGLDLGSSDLVLGSVDLGEHYLAMDSGFLEGDRPPLRWQLTEEENFALGTPTDTIQHALTGPADLSAELEPLGSADVGYQFGTLDAEFGVEGRPPLRWQLTEEENFLLDTPSKPAEAPVLPQEATVAHAEHASEHYHGDSAAVQELYDLASELSELANELAAPEVGAESPTVAMADAFANPSDVSPASQPLEGEEVTGQADGAGEHNTLDQLREDIGASVSEAVSPVTAEEQDGDAHSAKSTGADETAAPDTPAGVNAASADAPQSAELEAATEAPPAQPATTTVMEERSESEEEGAQYDRDHHPEDDDALSGAEMSDLTFPAQSLLGADESVGTPVKPDVSMHFHLYLRCDRSSRQSMFPMSSACVSSLC
jgi:hypothetical protein